MRIPISLLCTNSEESRNVDTNALIDCGAEGTFIDQNFVRINRIPVTRLKKPIEVFNVDGTPNKRGEITRYTRLKVTVKGRKRRILFLVTGLGKESVIFGMPWFQKENPLIDWELGTLEWRPPKEDLKSGKPPPKPNFWIEEDDDEPYLETRNPFPFNHLSEDVIHQIWIQAKVTHSQTLAQQFDSSKEERSLEEMIPPKYHEFLDLFDKKAASRFPQPREWDHKIKLKEERRIRTKTSQDVSHLTERTERTGQLPR